VNGYVFSLVIDLQQETLTRLPNQDPVLTTLKKLNNQVIEDPDELSILKILEMGWGRKVNKKLADNFTSMNDLWDWPGRLSNAIVYVDITTDVSRIINELIVQGVRDIQLRITHSIDHHVITTTSLAIKN